MQHKIERRCWLELQQGYKISESEQDGVTDLEDLNFF